MGGVLRRGRRPYLPGCVGRLHDGCALAGRPDTGWLGAIAWAGQCGDRRGELFPPCIGAARPACPSVAARTWTGTSAWSASCPCSPHWGRGTGHGLLFLEHEDHLTGFYEHHGYTVADQVTLDLPGGPLMLRDRPSMRMAFKALEPRVQVRANGSTGGPVIGGLVQQAVSPLFTTPGRSRA